MPSPVKTIASILKNEDDFLVASHVNPDGDATGSIAAVGHMLKALGKKFTLYNASGMPSRNSWLPMPGPVHDTLPEELPEWTIVMDCGSGERVGDDLWNRREETRIINIDHHLGNPEFGEINWIEVKEPAVGSMAALLAKELNQPISGPMAECIYLAVATDTGFFTYGSTTPEVLELAAEMLRNGLDVEGINVHINKQWSLRRMKLWKEVIGSVETYFDGQVAIAVATQEMFDKTETGPGATEDIINFIRRLKTVRVAGVLREEGPDCYKFSLRSHGADNVQQVAASFGGGGHKNAAGGRIEASLETARAQLVECISQIMEL